MWSSRAGTTYQAQVIKPTTVDKQIIKLLNQPTNQFLIPVRMLTWKLLDKLGHPSLTADEEKERTKIHQENKSY